MKYIRTPLGIWEVIEETDTIYCVRAKGNPNHIYNKSKCQTNVIKSADTIEELCDEFVFEETYPSGLKRHIITEDVCVGTQFGAIWTDKGLIYVAKMNDKGELELL